MTGANVIKPYEAHGTFVAGVARCIAPAADIFVANAFKVAGSTLETHLARHLDAALADGYDLFHLSITAPTRNDLPLISFEGWLRRLHQYKGVACVVSAGNSGSALPTWPAAFPQVVSVGALAADWRSRAFFSNYGPWVDVYAPGRDLINAFASGTYTCYTAPYGSIGANGQPVGQERTFYGMAKWSGTSFSTPIVTGLIAARMSRTGENGKEAAAALLAEAQAQAIPGVGPILLPY
jgi:subtilisin family serine protease